MPPGPSPAAMPSWTDNDGCEEGWCSSLPSVATGEQATCMSFQGLATDEACSMWMLAQAPHGRSACMLIQL